MESSWEEGGMPELRETTTGDPLSELERAFIIEFLRVSGHTFESVRALPHAEAHALLQQASIHASCRLTEVESRAHYIHDIHRAPEI